MKISTGTPIHLESKNLVVRNKAMQADYYVQKIEQTRERRKPKPHPKDEITPERKAHIAGLIKAGDTRAAKKLCAPATYDKILGDVYVGRL